MIGVADASGLASRQTDEQILQQALTETTGCEVCPAVKTQKSVSTQSQTRSTISQSRTLTVEA